MKKQRNWRTTVVGLILTAIMLFPLYWMINVSLTPENKLRADPPPLFPTQPTFAGYDKVIHEQLPYLGTSFLVGIGTVLVTLIVAAPAGYALAKLRFRGKRWALGLIVATLLVPAQVRFVPVFSLLASVGLVNTLTGLILPFGVSALGTFLVRQALLSVPDAQIEAARIDGASELYIVYRLLTPLLKPTLVSFFLFSFVSHWNDYFWPLVLTTDEHARTLPLAIALLREQGTGVRWHLVMAGNVILSLPALAVFAAAQRHLLRAVSMRGFGG